MSEGAARPTRRSRGRWFDLAGMLGIGLVIVAAALLPAVTANSGETTTVSGDVTLDGEPLAFFPVGFWTTGEEGVVQSTRTDGNGRFTFEVSATLDGYAFAGSAPDSVHAVIDADGEQVVRGVIGGDVVKPIATALYQGHPTATGHSLSGGASAVHFRLQRPGRIDGTSPVAPAGVRAVQVRRADNSVVQTLRLDARGRYRSSALVPGDYAVVLVPKSPGLPSVADAVVRPGATVTASPPAPEAGATVTGTVGTDGRAAGGGIPVLLEQQGEVIAKATTTETGDWSFAGVAAGDYTVEVGRFDEPASVSASGVVVPVPNASPTPSPTPTLTPATPTPTPTTVPPSTAAIEPVEQTADTVLPAAFDVTVPGVLGEVSVTTDVAEAGQLTGTVVRPDAITGTETAPVRVVAEEGASGRIVRAVTADADGGYRLGGLDPGTTYRVWAVTQPDDPTLAEMGDATGVAAVGGASADVVVDRPALSLTGTVAGITEGRVAAGDASLLLRTGTVDESGAYALQGLVPGAYPVVVTSTGRIPSTPVGVDVTADDQVADLQAGPQPAVFKGWFIASGAGVPSVSGLATDGLGHVVRFGPKTDDGNVEVPRLTPGTYEYDAESFRGSAPAVDGPWFYVPPTGSFSLSDGAITDVGPIVLHVRSH